MESLATSLDKFVDQSLKQLFREYLRSSTNVSAKNNYSDKDTTSKSLNSLKKKTNIVVLAADKKSCTVILNKDNNIEKVNSIINDGINQMKYVEITGDTCNGCGSCSLFVSLLLYLLLPSLSFVLKLLSVLWRPV